MVSAADAAVVGGMALFGLLMAGVATVVVRRMVEEFGGDGADRYRDLALYGMPPYVAAFVVFGLTFVLEVETLFGVDALYVGVAIMLLSAVPWGVAIVGGIEAGVDGAGPG